jgi:hypothetical protein
MCGLTGRFREPLVIRSSLVEETWQNKSVIKGEREPSSQKGQTSSLRHRELKRPFMAATRLLAVTGVRLYGFRAVRGISEAADNEFSRTTLSGFWDFF